MVLLAPFRFHLSGSFLNHSESVDSEIVILLLALIHAFTLACRSSIVNAQAFQTDTLPVVELLSEGKRVEIGGPAADYAGVSTRKHVGAVRWHNPNATTTSTGCVFNCGFCLVPKIEGDLKEKESWDRKPVFYDNNITACSRRHFDRVIDSAKGLSGVEFNQGISAALLTRTTLLAWVLFSCGVKCGKVSPESVR